LDCSGAELSILITDDTTIHGLNRQWRGKDRPTDVLSFPQDAEGQPEGAVRLLGDVVISADTAARQAEESGESLEQAVTRLLIHGVLHLLGHDHVHGGHQARKMKQEEARVMAAVRRAAKEAP